MQPCFTDLLRIIAMHLHQLGDIKLGSLQDLGLADVHILQGVDAYKNRPEEKHVSLRQCVAASR